MQLSLMQFASPRQSYQAALGRQGSSNSSPVEDDDLEPIEFDISEDAERIRTREIIHSAAEFLIISISGCNPKR